MTGFQASDTVYFADHPVVCWTGVSGAACTRDEQTADLSFILPERVGCPGVAWGSDTSESLITSTQRDQLDETGSTCSAKSDVNTEACGSATTTIATTVHGIAGYFTSTLQRGVVMDTCHTSKNFNSHHWEAFYFPLKEPVRRSAHLQEHLSARHCSRVYSYYFREQMTTSVVFDCSLRVSGDCM